MSLEVYDEADEVLDPTEVVGLEPPATTSGLQRGASIGRYVVLDRLAAGGMGVVYKAYDPVLDRQVALKLLHTGEKNAGFFKDRLLREAQGLARLSHPNVVAVHDVGEIDGQVFLAMEFVEGETLRQWAARVKPTQRQVLEAYVAAGDGLAAAHRARLVHRDFKPDNVIVGSDGRVRVLDFGLVCAPGLDLGDHARALDPAAQARRPALEMSQVRLPSVPVANAPGSDELGAPGLGADTSPAMNRLQLQLTQAGAVLGTPRYMAPEQHLGAPIDERADQFAFCVSLYAALYGMPPFAGETAETLRDAVLNGRISDAPQGSKVPARLRTILLRGLATEPAQRWPSMEALLEQLRRDPGAALRRAASIGSLVVAGLIAVAAAIYAVHSRQVAAAQAELAQNLGQQVAQMESTARIAALLPVHDLGTEEDDIRRRMAEIEAQMRGLGPRSTALGHYALGRGHMALERWEEALAELEQARRSGYRGEGLSYALGFTQGTLYQHAMAQLTRSDDPEADEKARATIVKNHREPALRYLHEARRSGAGFGKGQDDFVRALVALYEERFDVALALSRKAAIENPGLFEARTLEGDIHASLAADRAWKGDDPGELEELERAGLAYAAALEVARSGSAALLGDCRRLLKTAHHWNRQSLSPERAVGQAVAACGRAVAVHPSDALPLSLQAEAWRSLGEYQAEHALDPKAALDAALGLAGRALALEPNHVPTLHVLSDTNEILGGYLFRKGEDARAAVARAIDFARRTIALDPRRFSAYASLGYALRVRALDEVRHGRDPRGTYGEIIAAAQKQRRSFRGSTRALRLMQSGYANLGIWQRDHGVDPSEALRHGIAACKEEIARTPNAAGGHINLCYDQWALANHQIRIGHDPRPALEEGMAACRRAIELTPNDWIPHLDMAVSRSALARFHLDRGTDPMALVTEARDDLERSLAIDQNMVTLRYLGEVEQTAARWLTVKSGDAGPRFAAAEQALRKVIAADAADADGLRRLADLLRYRAEWLLATQRPAEAVLREGLDVAGRAQTLEPDLGEGSALVGALHLLASRAATQPEERARHAQASEAALRKAIEQNGFLRRQYGPLHAEALLRSRH